jgi:EAL domain-containing protein (putative c-di-GMP-specific phosphodiesterase class I)
MEANAEWAEKGEEVVIGVNVSATQLADDEFPDMVEEMLARYEVPADRLMLELSETSAMTDAEESLAMLNRLREKGVELCLDDFGTASSPLLMLYRMPFSEVKVDTSFILEVRRSEEARAIVAAVVNLAHALGLNVCAEGVESEPTLAFLRSVGCDIAQGYYVCKPLPKDRAYRFLARWTKHVEEQEKKIREQWSMAG